MNPSHDHSLQHKHHLDVHSLFSEPPAINSELNQSIKEQDTENLLKQSISVNNPNLKATRQKGLCTSSTLVL